ncbi:MAG: glycosyltransferase family 4 protein [Bryobacteraceae bacterium]
MTLLEPLVGKCRMHLFVTRTDLPDAQFIRKTKLPAPRRPVFLSSFLFTFLATLSYSALYRRAPGLRIGTEGAFPFCDISYAHSCHSVLLFRYRQFVGGGRLRHAARIVSHIWGAVAERAAFRSAKTIVVPSQGLARELQSAYPKLVRGKIHVIPNPVDTEAFPRPSNFDPGEAKARQGIPASAFVLSFCALGNFELKGLRLVLEALAALDGTVAHLIVIGGRSSEIRDYESIAGNRVHFVGFQTDIRPYLWSSDAFVFPSAHETFPLVCLQAAAAGLPLITTRLHGVEEFMVDGETGWIVERNALSIQSAIQEAAADRARTAAMGSSAKERVQMYSKQQFRSRWMELLGHAIGVPGLPNRP